MTEQFTVGEGAAVGRLDVYLANALGRTRSHAQHLLASGSVLVNDHPARPSYLIQPGDTITVSETQPNTVAPIDLQLPVVYEDTDILVINKPAALTVHPGNSASGKPETQPTVVTFMRDRTTDSDPDRPGIVHRLDRDTSGLLILAKTAAAKALMQQQFRTHAVHKTYLLLTVGHPDPPEAVIQLPTGRHPAHPLKRAVVASGRPSVTRYRTLAEYPGYSLIEAKPETGRTHQLRVHFAAMGHPVAGDTTYGPPRRPLHLKRQFLHASELEFTTPAGHLVHLTSPLPPDLESVLKVLSDQV